MTDKALEEIIFRAVHGVVQSLSAVSRPAAGGYAAERGADAGADGAAR